MNAILISTILVSILHAIIPSHWLPLLTISKTNNWSRWETLKITLIMGLAHVLSTILVGIVLYFIGVQINTATESNFNTIISILLIAMGCVFIYRHYKHLHFHLQEGLEKKQVSKNKIISTLVGLMFISPCLEVESFFFSAAPYGGWFIFLLALLYAVVSISGMFFWMFIALKGTQKFNWHKIEHNAGLITGFVLILCGVFTFFIH